MKKQPLFRIYKFILFFLSICALAHGRETIAIFTGKITGAKPWDPDSIKSGITGSEEAVIYVSQKLAHLGYRVVVYADIPPDSPHAKAHCNPRFIDLTADNGALFDIAIAWRMPTVANILKTRARKVYFWPHDLCTTSFLATEIEGFDDILWLSESQRQQWVSLNPSFAKFTKIFGNGINPEQFKEIEERANPYSCIYGSSYERGLEVLLDIWPAVKREFPQATLDIYYGWQSLALRPISPLMEGRLRSQVASYAFLGVKEHGLVSHEELTRAYERASFWTYPCTELVVETFCISALRAQFAGAIPVVIQGSALKETVPHGYSCLRREDYLNTLLQAMRKAETISLQERKKQREFILQKYTWEAIAGQWSKLFRE